MWRQNKELRWRGQPANSASVPASLLSPAVMSQAGLLLSRSSQQHWADSMKPRHLDIWKRGQGDEADLSVKGMLTVRKKSGGMEGLGNCFLPYMVTVLRLPISSKFMPIFPA